MGMGDEIMAAGLARDLARSRDPHYRDARLGNTVAIVDQKFNARWSEVWEGLPYISKTTAAADFVLMNCPGVRHYYAGMDGNQINWVAGKVVPGEIRLTDEERKWAAQETELFGRFVVVETRYKAKGGGGVNKLWPHWLDFFARRPDVTFYPMRDAPTFRHACAILERSIGYVGHEGGLHHAAAALGKPAVVVFGGYISPAVTGYEAHRNLYTHDERYPLGCGTVTPCDHCRAAMEAITVEQVVEAVKEMVQ